MSHVARKLLHIIYYGVLTHQRPYALPAAYAGPAQAAEMGLDLR